MLLPIKVVLWVAAFLAVIVIVETSDEVIGASKLLTQRRYDDLNTVTYVSKTSDRLSICGEGGE